VNGGFKVIGEDICLMVGYGAKKDNIRHDVIGNKGLY